MCTNEIVVGLIQGQIFEFQMTVFWSIKLYFCFFILHPSLAISKGRNHIIDPRYVDWTFQNASAVLLANITY